MILFAIHYIIPPQVVFVYEFITIWPCVEMMHYAQRFKIGKGSVLVREF